jgi:hypothetical protein
MDRLLSSSFGPAWGAPAFVWGVWAVLLVTALGFVANYAHNVPYVNDWDMLVPYITGEEPITLGYLWEQDCEHRYFLSKCIILTALKLSGGDFRAPTVFFVFALGALASALIQVAKSLRGWTSYTDAFLPLALLPCEISNPVPWAWLHVYLVPSLVASILLLIIVRRGTQLTLGSATLAATCLVLLPLCSAAGIIYLPALALWLGYAAVVSWRSAEPLAKWNSLVILSGVLTAFLLAALYFRGYVRTFSDSYAPPSPGVWASLVASLAFLSTGFGGDAAKVVWPFSGLAMFILLLSSAGALVRAAWSKQDQNRSRALGLLCFLGASVMLALGIGWGRGGFGVDNIFLWYQLLAVPILHCLYFVWVLRGPGRGGTVGQACMFTCLVLATCVNIPAGFETGQQRHLMTEAFERDVRDGVPPYMLVARYADDLYQLTRDDQLASWMDMLRQAGIGSFRYLKNDPAFAEVPLPLEPIVVNQAKWQGGMVHDTSAESYVTFALPKPMFIAGIRMQYTTPSVISVASWIRVFWRKRDAPNSFEGGHPYEPGMTMLNIAEKIDQIRISAGDLPCDFHILEIVLLVPETDGTQSPRRRRNPPGWRQISSAASGSPRGFSPCLTSSQWYDCTHRYEPDHGAWRSLRLNLSRISTHC